MAFNLFQSVRVFTRFLLLVALLQVFTGAQVHASDVTFAKTQLCLSDLRVIDIELAVTPAQQRQGLMYRESLAANAGMLFVYNESAQRSFWMMNTLIPLDIAYISKEGSINEVLTMQPCRRRMGFRCPSYSSSEPFRYALEMNAGWFEYSNINAGSYLKGGDCETSLADWLNKIHAARN